MLQDGLMPYRLAISVTWLKLQVSGRVCKQLHACLQAAAAPAPSADSAAQAPSPVASAVASLAARLESGQASPALIAQLQETQTLLDAALLVRCATALLLADETKVMHCGFVSPVSNLMLCRTLFARKCGFGR